MLSRAFEWYRVVNVRPTSETIENRKAAVLDIIKALDKAKDWDLALDCAAGVVTGFEANFTQDSSIVLLLVGAIRAHDAAFPEDLSENTLELRACAALALGEILVRNNDQLPGSDALLIGSVLQSGLYIRPSHNGRHLKQLISELEGTAAAVLTSGALSRRQRLSNLAQQLEQLKEPSDLPTAWKTLIPALKAAMKEITHQSAMDREEINVLWWMFAGASNATGQKLAEMSPGAAALYCGAELGGQCLLPATSSLEAIVRQAYETGRKPKDMTNRTIEGVAADWQEQLPSVLVSDEDTRDLAQKYPALFPLSWLCARLLDSKGATGWAMEFERMTKIPASYSLPSVNWAIQAFRERVAYRLYAESFGDE